MKTVRHCALLVLLVAICTAVGLADEPGRHPAYLHALVDLRHARAHLERITGSDRMNDEEQHAIAEIDKAIAEIKRAAINDGKDLNDHPPIDERMGRAGRYQRTLELLDMARNDIGHEEDDRWARGLRNRAMSHINDAHRIVEHLVIQAHR